jgi:hypothetical protein
MMIVYIACISYLYWEEVMGTEYGVALWCEILVVGVF